MHTSVAPNQHNLRIYCDRSEMHHLSFEELRMTFAEYGYIQLQKILTNEAMALLEREVFTLRQLARPCNFVMPGPNTPRIMSTVGGTKIRRCGRILMDIYKDHSTLDLLKDLTGHAVYPCDHPEEFVVVNYQDGPGQTHGWHFDDPDLALVIVVTAPDQGGRLQMAIPVTEEPSAKASAEVIVEQARRGGRLYEQHLSAGEAYVLHASQILHRITPLREGDRRSAVCMAFSFLARQSFGDSANLLYGEHSLP